jgi:hypothetical protein
MLKQTHIFWLAGTLALSVAMADSSDPKQVELDNACEAQRQIKLAPMREQAITECVGVEGKEQDYCERFYRDFGERSGDRPAMFYDLPECVDAFEHQKNRQLH